MTPEEKAKELVDIYYSLISGLPLNFVCKLITLPNGDSYWEIAKQCAMIAVDEILNLDSGDSVNKEYWQEVKQEIEKL